MEHSSKATTQAEYGQRLLPALVDECARTNPDFVFAMVPKTSNLADGFQDITVKSFARAVNAVAHRIDTSAGRSTKFDTIAYIGPTDLRYFVIALAAAKVGYKTLLPSPRNSIEGLLSLLESTQCHYILSAPESKVDHILAKRTMWHAVIHTLNDWVDQEAVAPYPFEKTFEEAAHDPFIVIHTSGSTGLPKPITLRHGGLATVDAHHLMPPLNGYSPMTTVSKTNGVERVFAGLPPFHVAGILGALTLPLCYTQTMVWPPADRPISADLVEELLDNLQIDTCYLAPSLLEEMSQSQASLEKLAKFKSVKYGGGPLAQRAGDTIARYTVLHNIIGSSEAAFLPLYDKEPEDWIYFHLDPRMKGIQFREFDGGVYEQVFVRHPSTDPYHSVWYTFPDKQEYAPSDLFSKHPTKPNLWRYEGRADNMIVFSNGEKFNPGGMEAALQSHPDVAHILVVGQARFQPAALIQLRGQASLSDKAKKEMLDSLKPYIDKANDAAPGFAQLQPDLIAFTNAEKSMSLTDKGTVKRAATAKLFEHEIDQVYADAEVFATSLSTVQLDARDLPALEKAILESLIAILGFKDLSPEQDIFTVGMDSLQVMNLVRQLKSSFTGEEGGIPAHLITPRLIYSNPTATKLASALHQLTGDGEDVYKTMEEERIKNMEEMLTKYSKDLPEVTPENRISKDGSPTIVLTGSTGSLGSYLLDALLSSGQVLKIICLNRGVHGEDKQKSVNASRGLVTEWGSKVQFLRTDLGKPKLGLNTKDYDTLVQETSFIIHNQWQVDFNLSLESFEPHMAGVRDLIELSTQSPKKPPILFTSSISTLNNWTLKHPNEKVPERAFHDFTIPAAMGYGESKYISERLLEIATEKCGLSAAVVRVGQLAGPVVKDGVWSKQEWLPSIIASSKYLCKIPQTLPSMDTIPWVPVDLTARIIVELLLSNLSPTPSTPFFKNYNLVNPHAANWSSLIPTITHSLSSPTSTIEPVSFETWLEALRATAARTEDVKKNPGIKLLEFYGGMEAGVEEAVLETRETEERSATMRGLKPVGEEWMRIWLGQWKF